MSFVEVGSHGLCLSVSIKFIGVPVKSSRSDFDVSFPYLYTVHGHGSMT